MRKTCCNRLSAVLCSVFLLLTTAVSLAAATTVTVDAAQEPRVYHQVWIEKGAVITFSISGAWTMWDPSWAPVDWRGHTHFRKIEDHHLGTLMGGVAGSAAFEIEDGMEWRSPSSGYLVLYPHRNRYTHLAARGQLRVTVDGHSRKVFTLAPEAQRVLDEYRSVYLASTVSELGWTGSIAGNDAGRLPQEVLDKVLARVNYFRRLAGLPPVVFTAEKNRLAQHAALIMLANKRLSHYPPASWSCWSEAGKKGAAASNLGLGPLAGFITQYMEDPGASNAHCGHRRWVLYSKAAEFGFGAAFDPAHYTFAAEALYVTGGSRTSAGVPAFIAWPPAGYVPAPLVFPRGSFSLPVTSDRADFSGAVITMRGSDGESIPVRKNPFRAFGDTGITWDIVPAVADIAAFRLKWNNRPVTVRIDGVSVDGEAKNWEYSFTVVAP